MSVYKELFYLAKEVEKNSKRIYPDAADYGIRIDNFKDPVLEQLRQIIKMYDGKVATTRHATGATQKILIDGYDEWQTRKEVQFNFCYVHINKNVRRKSDPLGYLYVN